jgi:hypothetical protein
VKNNNYHNNNNNKINYLKQTNKISTKNLETYLKNKNKNNYNKRNNNNIIDDFSYCNKSGGIVSKSEMDSLYDIFITTDGSQW